uniref:DNA topoisomerase n=1 Tax=viral metagenome TaxID=1070528 RepID=A0A6C0CY05_9ZZZZ
MKQYFVRKKYGKSFKYYDKKGNLLPKSKVKQYLNFYIPPAYDDVKINMNKNKVLAIGYDDKSRPQYIYDHKYTMRQSKTKFKKLINFGENYEKIYKKIETDLSSKDEKTREIAMILMLIIDCNFRVGNNKYTRDNKSYGVSTLEKKHIQNKSGELIIDFVGKKGVRNKCTIKNDKIKKKLTKKKKQLKKNYDKVFSYKRNGDMFYVSANDVNEYLKKIGNYSTKYFRTWNANIEFIKESKRAKDMNECIERVADKLHHTPTICKKDYLNKKLLEFYKKNPKKFKDYFNKDINKKFIQFLKK